MIGEYAQGPHVDVFLALCTDRHLGGEVLGSSALEGAGDVLLQLDRDVEVRELYVAVPEDQQVGGLQVRVCDVLVVKILQPQDRAPQDKPDCILLALDEFDHPLRTPFDKALDVSSPGPLEHFKIIRVVPKGGVQAGYEVGPRFLEDLFLEEDVGDEIFLLD